MKIALSAPAALWRFLGVSLALHLLVLLLMRVDRPPLPGGKSALPVHAVLSGLGRRANTPPDGGDKPWRRLTPAMPVAAEAPKHVKTKPVEKDIRAQEAAANLGASTAASGGITDSVGAAASTSASSLGPSADDVRQYVLLLVPEARRLKRYPALARERGWEGTAEVTVTLVGGRAAPALGVTRSSGFAVLDEQALAMIGHAVASVTVPEALRGKDAAIPVPIRFSLED